MTNNGNAIEMKREVDILKLVSHKWLFMIPVEKYPDYNVSITVKSELEDFVNAIGCKLIECGTGTASYETLIVAYTVKIEDEVNQEDLVRKVKGFLTEKVIPVV